MTRGTHVQTPYPPRGRAAAPVALAVALCALGLLIGTVRVAGAVVVDRGLVDTARTRGTARAIVQLAVAVQPEGRLDGAATARQREIIAAAQDAVLARLAGVPHGAPHRYRTIPAMAMALSAEALERLATADDLVARVSEDALARPSLLQSAAIVQAPQAQSAGFTGVGSVVAVLDTGVDTSHPFLGGRVVAEACFSTTDESIGAQSLCPDGSNRQFGEGAGRDCFIDDSDEPGFSADCEHGTHIAGIVAGNGASAGQSFSGVAPAASLMSVQIFSRFDDPRPQGFCQGNPPCVRTFRRDLLDALEFVFQQRHLNLVAVNLSVEISTQSPGGLFGSRCDDFGGAEKVAIDNLRSVGIATIVPAGNLGHPSQASFPACISSAIAVGSIAKNRRLSSFSNVAPYVAFYAPGEGIVSSLPGGSFGPRSGTSAAAAHVSGVIAGVRQAEPEQPVRASVRLLQATADPVENADLACGGIPRELDAINRAAQGYAFVTLSDFCPNTAPPFRPGDAMTVDVDVKNGQGKPALGLYMGIILPDGRLVLFSAPPLRDIRLLENGGEVPPPALTVPTDQLYAARMLEHTLRQAEVPAGSYAAFAALYDPSLEPVVDIQTFVIPP